MVSSPNTTLVNLYDEEVEFEQEQLIGMVHPLQLTEEKLQNWKRKFFDLSIEPIFAQLERPVFIVGEGEENKKILFDYDGKEAESGAIKATLEKYGWKKGGAADGSYIDSFSFDEIASQITAILEVQGVFVGGFGYDHEPKLGRLYFIHSTGQPNRWIQHPASEKDERLVPLRDIPPIFYSEVRASISSVKLKKEEEITTA